MLLGDGRIHKIKKNKTKQKNQTKTIMTIKKRNQLKNFRRLPEAISVEYRRVQSMEFVNDFVCFFFFFLPEWHWLAFSIGRSLFLPRSFRDSCRILGKITGALDGSFSAGCSVAFGRFFTAVGILWDSLGFFGIFLKISRPFRIDWSLKLIEILIEIPSELDDWSFSIWDSPEAPPKHPAPEIQKEKKWTKEIKNTETPKNSKANK